MRGIRFGCRKAAVSEIPEVRLNLSGRTGYVEVDPRSDDAGRYARIDLEGLRNVLDDDLSCNGILAAVVLDDGQADFVFAGIVVPDGLYRVAFGGNPSGKAEVVDEFRDRSFLRAARRTVEPDGRRSVEVLVFGIRRSDDDVRYQ